MRYYKIEICNPTTEAVVKTYTSYVNGQTLSGAMDIELDVPVIPYAAPDGEAYLKIWGVRLDEISQASNLNGALVKIFAGMQAGLPLANPKQAGLIAQGYVLQAFGNWIGNEMSLDLILTVAPTKSQPVNIVLDWKQGTTLAAALANTLQVAYPGYKQRINISSDLVLKNDEQGYYQSLTQLAQYVKQRSAAIVGGPYRGVDIFLNETTFWVFDGTAESAPKLLAFRDLIGQPTWIDATSVQAKFVLRADLKVGDFIKFPVTQVTTTAQPGANLINQKLTFQGTFLITKVRHVGHFRQPDAASWATVVDAASTAPVNA